MKNMTTRELNKKIKNLKAELKKELEENGNTKKAIFLQATINIYTKELNK